MVKRGNGGGNVCGCAGMDLKMWKNVKMMENVVGEGDRPERSRNTQKQHEITN